MTTGLRQGSVITEIGPGAIIHAFFSTVCANLEPAGWGTCYPKLMNCLYQGRLEALDAIAAMNEVDSIISKLSALPVDALVWDIEYPNAKAPAEYDSYCDKSSLLKYFRTTTGRNLALEIKDNLESQLEFGGPLEIISYGAAADLLR